MTDIPQDVKYLLDRQHFIVISSLDDNGRVDTAAKGILETDPKGKIFALDLYRGRTYRNIKKNPHVTLTIIDEQKFKGYSIKGRAKIINEEVIPKSKMDIWQYKLSKRIARRIIRHVKTESPGHEGIPEAKFPFPKHVIEITVDAIVDLAPKGGGDGL